MKTMLRRNHFYKSVFRINHYPISISHVRSFSKSQRRLFPSPSRLPATPVAPFLQVTDDIRSFIGGLLVRDSVAIQQLNHTIEDNNNSIRSFYSETNLTVNNDANIELLNDLIEEDMNERQTYQESANLLSAIYIGVNPPIHNTSAWLNLKNDLDNSEDPALQSLREYVQEVIDTNIRDQFVEMTMDMIRTGRENLLEIESRDNSQYSDELDELDSSYESDHDVYYSADTHHDESSFNDSDSNNNSPIIDQSINSNDNLSNVDNELNSDIDPYHDSYESNINQSFDQDGSNSSSDDKFITDDALDISDTLHMFYDESSEKNQSTIDFVLQRQQEEMPDIMDSDGGE
jgi:hypothetical protein